MSELLTFVIVGLVTGSVYGITGMGLVLTYKTSGIFNFAHGAVATLGAYAFFELQVERDVPWLLAMVVSVVVVGVFTGLILERLARALAPVSVAMQIVATVGLLIAIQAVVAATSGASTRPVPPYFPTDNIRLSGVNVGVDQIIVFSLALASAVVLYLFFRFTQLGLSMQAVVDDPNLVAMGGRSPGRIRRIAWMIGSSFACLSGVLLVPSTGLDPDILTLLVVQAFGAAAIGAFSSLPLTYVGGLAVGVTSALCTDLASHNPEQRWLAGLAPSVPFLILFIVLLIVPRRRLVDLGSVNRLVAKAPPSFPVPVKLTGAVLTLGGLILVPHVVGTKLPVYTNGLVFVIIFLSLHLLVRTSGQVSLATASFSAVGAASFSHLVTGAHLPWALALLGAGLIAVPIGAVVAIPAIRLSGLYLAVATFGFAILLEQLFFSTGLMFGRSGAVDTPRPEFWVLGDDKGYYYLVLVIAGLMAAVATAVIRGRLGRLLRAMSDSPMALSTQGTSINVSRVLIFCISAFMAGIAGALFGALIQSVNGSSFQFFKSLQYLAILAISGAAVKYAPIPTAIIAGASIAVIPAYINNATFIEYLPAIFGVFAILNALTTDRGGEHRAEPRAEPVRDEGSATRIDRPRENSPVKARMIDA